MMPRRSRGHTCRDPLSDAVTWAHCGGMAEKKTPKKRPKGVDDHGPSIKDPEMYEALVDDGMSRGKAAAISNAAANTSRSEMGRRGGHAGNYADRTVPELRQRAKELGHHGYSHLRKDELIDLLQKG